MDSTTVPYLGEALARMLWASPESMLLKLSAAEMSDSLSALNLEPSDLQIRQRGHSGPSSDRLMKLRSALEVKDHGRSAGDGTRRRYVAHTRVARDFAKLPLDIQRHSKKAPAALSKLSQARLRFGTQAVYHIVWKCSLGAGGSAKPCEAVVMIVNMIFSMVRVMTF